MKIIINGAGEVGQHLAKMLAEEFHDITVIDEDAKKLENISAFSDVYTIQGDAKDFNILNKANLSKCNLFIAVSPVESDNILSAILAKQLGAKKCIARIDNDTYLKPFNKEVLINLGIDYMFYPDKLAANEVLNLLGNTAATEYVSFSGGKLSLMVFKISVHSRLVDKRIMDITKTEKKLKYRIVAISRDGETIIPSLHNYIREGDTIYIIVDNRYSGELYDYIGQRNLKVNNLIILGGGQTGERIARSLEGTVNVKLIDNDKITAERLAESLEDTLVINSEGKDIEVIYEEDLENTDVFVALTGHSETNILASMLAKKKGVKKVIADVENFSYINLAESMGIDTIINKKLITASTIFRFTMNTDVQAIRCLNGCDAEVLEFIAKPNSLITRASIRETPWPADALIGGVVRGESVFIATGDSEVKAYDRVVVFALPEAITKLANFFN